MADRLYTSSESDEILSALRFETKLEKYILARIAFSVSLLIDGADLPISSNFSGSEMKRPTFVGTDEVFLKAILAYVHKITDIIEDDFYSNKSLIKNHIDNGCKHLSRIFEESGHSSELLLKKITELVEFSGRKEIRGSGLDLYIGKTVLDKKEIILEFNNTRKHANSHLAIMGKPGVGKTQFLLKILADIRIKSNYLTNFIFFDYKGDVVDNQKFLDIAKVQPFRLLQGSQTLPINPFVLPNYDEQTINVSAREKAESFASINSKLGVVQKGALTEAIRAAYAKRSDSTLPFPDFQDVLEITMEMYEEGNKRDDSLIEVLRDLSDFDLFWKHGSENEPIEKLTNRTLLIDVHAMPVLKELVGYLVIERLYKEMAALPDSPVHDGRRTIRTILVIDEAHNYLGQKNIFLERIIREGRSKGIVVFFASQSPNDYQQKFFNFQELLEFAYIFQCEGVSASSMQDILGCSKKTANDLQTEVARLEPFQVIARSGEKTAEFMKFAAEAFYKCF
ncbi:DndE family protein [Pelosinus baikalensis]|uniref:DndE family protein n=1 Tax=Pelosinus baikalensis TaxID=2892015 RepID=A0ABS8HRF7_9FIRM|nr:DndE family protein [Pelosinus baikalensis]MCC5465772.1 DndE family protein [Pelosinus baikalensis]